MDTLFDSLKEAADAFEAACKSEEGLEQDFLLAMSLSTTNNIPAQLTPERILEVAEYALVNADKLCKRLGCAGLVINNFKNMKSSLRRFGCI